ncbi:MAG: hypothetical protein OEW14_19485, partial [Nitrospira sp.]|nr:hypothetical protein [Nitrospira sp.]
GMMGGMMGREGMEQRAPRPQTGKPPRTMPIPDEQPETLEAPPSQDESSDMEKATNFMKGLFGQ